MCAGAQTLVSGFDICLVDTLQKEATLPPPRVERETEIYVITSQFEHSLILLLNGIQRKKKLRFLPWLKERVISTSKCAHWPFFSAKFLKVFS